MLNQILRKRTQVEIDAWQAVRDLMPRNRKSKGIQYETLEFLFDHLYERVSEEDLAAYLLEVKGHLQRTGDPVKGAINQAVKELQRLPERAFEIVKIQETTPRGPRRLIQMNYTRFEEVIGPEIYSEYLKDVLKNERDIVVRGISSLIDQSGATIFPGLRFEELDSCRAEFLLSPAAILPESHHVNIRFIPPSVANMHFLLVYEDKDQLQPFLGFIAKADLSVGQGREFILYRGIEKAPKLKFLDRTWQSLYAHALDASQLASLEQEAKALAAQIEGGDHYRHILNGLVIESCERTAEPLGT